MSYILSVASIVFAVAAWLTTRQVGAATLSVYDIFPLFGLAAFSLMWAQVVGDTLARLRGVRPAAYRRLDAVISGMIVSLIVLHPLLLWLGLFRDGAGLPPASYMSTYGVTVAATIGLLAGTVALVIFLAYELRRWYADAKWWPAVMWLQSLAMVLIFFHALALGQEAGHSWFTVIWLCYGVTLAGAVAYNYLHKQRRKS